MPRSTNLDLAVTTGRVMASRFSLKVVLSSRTIHLAPEDLGIDGGLGTFGMVDSEGNAKIPLKIREGSTVIR